MWSCQGLNSWIINDNSCSKTINSTLNNSTSAKPTILALASGKADYKTQHSTLPPAWFRSTGLSLFNHTCFTLLYNIYYILMIIILRVKHGIDICIRYNVFIRKHTINKTTSVIIDISGSPDKVRGGA